MYTYFSLRNTQDISHNFSTVSSGQILFVCNAKSPYTVYCWLCIETRGGGYGVLNMDIFVLVEKSSLGTNAFIIVKIHVLS